MRSRGELVRVTTLPYAQGSANVSARPSAEGQMTTWHHCWNCGANLPYIVHTPTGCAGEQPGDEACHQLTGAQTRRKP